MLAREGGMDGLTPRVCVMVVQVPIGDLEGRERALSVIVFIGIVRVTLELVEPSPCGFFNKNAICSCTHIGILTDRLRFVNRLRTPFLCIEPIIDLILRGHRP